MIFLRAKEKKGITLIALVITIIVLLILAGVTIAALSGNNGILQNAARAKEKQEQATINEEKTLSKMEASTNLDKKEYKDSNGDIAIIPSGFTVSQVEGEQTIKEGLVVIDYSGNEFVWIPVNDINDMTQCSTAGGSCNIQLEGDILRCITHDSTKIVGKLYATRLENNFNGELPNITYNANGGLREPAIVTGNSSGTGTSYDGDTVNNYLNIINEILDTKYSSASEFLIDMQDDFYDMAKSVTKYKGFYIGRYEMSKSTNNTVQSKANSIALTTDNDNEIPEMNGNTWYGLYAYGKTYTNSYDSAVSSMVWGSQYDAMMRWMEYSGDNVTSANDIIKNTNQTTTGFKEDTDVIRNIYDLYGGRHEFTLEAANVTNRVGRGGKYDSSNSPSQRYGGTISGTGTSTSSRLALYIKY